jgi:hypothetical protein
VTDPDESPIWAHSSEVAVVAGEGRVAMVDLAHLEAPPMVLNDTGAQIWHAIDGRRTTDQVVAHVAGEAGLEPDEIREHVAAFLDSLVELGVVVRAAEEQGPAGA